MSEFVPVVTEGYMMMPKKTLADFESLARWVTNCTGHGINARQREQGERLLELITKEQK